MTPLDPARRRHPRRSAVSLLVLLIVGGCTLQPRPGVAGVKSGGSTAKGPTEPLNKPAGVTQTVQVLAGLLPLGAVPYDNMVLPLVNPDGTLIAVQSGAPPTWNSLLAKPGAELPTATRVQVFRLDRREDSVDAKRDPPALVATLNEPLLLGRSCDVEGFLVESPREDGSRWIGKVGWESGAVSWLVQDESVNAFAVLGPDGRLAWSRRAVRADHFDLVVRAGADEWTIPAKSDDWLMPTWPNPGDGLFVFNLSGRDLDVCYGNAESSSAFLQSLQRQPLVNDGAVSTAYQAMSAQSGSCDTMAPIRDQLVYFHPAASRMALWRPLAAPGRKTAVLYPRSVAALVDQEEYAFTATSTGLIRQSLANSKEYIQMAAGPQVPHATTSETWPYILLCPSEGTVGVIAMRLLPREQAVFRTR